MPDRFAIRTLLRTAPGAPLREPVNEIGRPEPSERCRPGAEDPLRGDGQMRRRREVEDPRDVPDVVPRILGQLRRRNEANEIDDPLEIGSSRPREVSAQMLAAETDGFCQLGGGYRASRVRDHHLPRAALQLCREPERRRRLTQRLAEPGGERSRAALSSIPSTMKSMNPSPAHLATAGVSEGRSGRIPKKGALGNSAANEAAFHISSSGAPRSMRAASTMTRRNTDSSSSADRVEMIFQRRRGKAERTSARARSRSRCTTSVGIDELSVAAATPRLRRPRCPGPASPR